MCCTQCARQADPQRVGAVLMGAGDLVTHDIAHNPVVEQVAPTPHLHSICIIQYNTMQCNII